MAEGEPAVMQVVIEYIILVLLAVFTIQKVGEAWQRFRNVRTLQSDVDRLRAQQQVTRPDSGRTGAAKRLTPPPSPIDRTAFLQARIAYLAHMRDEVIEIDVKDEITKEVVQRSRKLTKKEMIEAVNLQNEDHVDALFETWDAAQRRQREP